MVHLLILCILQLLPTDYYYIGVSLTRRLGHLSEPWRAKIRINNQHILLGIFATEEEAAEAYRKVAAKRDKKKKKVSSHRGK